MTTLRAKDVYAGNCVVTISFSHAHFTFRVVTKQDPQISFVSLLTGPDNEHNYSYLGILHYDPNHKVAYIKRTAKSIKQLGYTQFIEWVLTYSLQDEPLPEGYEVRNAGRCYRCGRLLTVPSSIDQNYGPECVKAIN